MFHATRYLIPALFMAGCATPAEHGSHNSLEARQQTQAPLAQLVREATARFKHVQVAVEEGYAPFLGCVSGGNGGAMGIHYVNGGLLDGTLNASRPEALMYEPKPDGSLRLVGVEYLTFTEMWHAANESAPVLEGHVLSYAGSPNRYGIPPHYQLHVWAWKHNSSGTFADWNPSVSCEAQELAQKR